VLFKISSLRISGKPNWCDGAYGAALDHAAFGQTSINEATPFVANPTK
jgi:hypothetical protein